MFSLAVYGNFCFKKKRHYVVVWLGGSVCKEKNKEERIRFGFLTFETLLAVPKR
jgi:hypothetical protein